MAKCKLSKRSYTWTDRRFVLEREDQRISEELHSDEQSAVGDYHSQLPFTTACAISSTIDNLWQYKSAASAPRLVVELG